MDESTALTDSQRSSISPSSSSSSLVDISANGIVGQEQTETAFEIFDDENTPKAYSNKPGVRGKSKTVRMVLLTQLFAGLQFAWAVELAYGTPYLLSLGMHKSHTAMVWLAGPLSGLITQPIVGALSDKSTSRFGRRRPFILGGSIAVVFAFIFIGWTKDMVEGLFGEGTPITIWVAILSLYSLDFAINAVQASCRALLIDSLPSSQQEEGTAWAGIMVGAGNVFGYFMGFVDLAAIFGNSQLKVLCVFASIILLSSNAIIFWAVTERVYSSHGSSPKTVFRSAIDTITTIFRSIRNLPEPVQQLCNVQFFAWIGWFPFLFYSSTWVAAIYRRASGDSTEHTIGAAERAGSFALLLHALVSLVASIGLPFLVTPSGSSVSSENFSWQHCRLPLPFLTLPKLWTVTHFIFAICMLSTWFVINVAGASTLLAIVGISWATSMWAPFCILGEYISEEQRANGIMPENGEARRSDESTYRLVQTQTKSTDADEDLVADDEGDVPLTFSANASRVSFQSQRSMDKSSQSPGDAAGTLLGISNMYVVLPQFLVNIFSSIVFAVFEGTTSHENADPDSIGFVLRFGGIMAIIAGFLSIKLWKRR
ncbi:2253_t:CDS:2 [Paraglomus occultum]|uniref:2253_t:CDS:1 n=1 Tax=Paraglomus occultum TaxID=144539 RepID=A0A9N9GN58_9GLOM|nr:2253_t:CDS:2 [Paraglomus occultum]